MSTLAEREALVRAARPLGRLRRGAFTYWTTWVGIFFAVVLIGVAFLGPYLAPYGVGDFVSSPFHRPTGTFLLGTDFLGRDVLSRVLDGGRVLVIQSLISAVLASIVGAVIGFASAYIGGWLDALVMRITDAFISIPLIIFALVLVTAAGASAVAVTIIVGVLQIPFNARFTRGIGLELVQEDFIVAARARGESVRYVIGKELLPNALTPIFINFAFSISYAALIVSSLAFFGFGAAPPSSDWGVMVNENRFGLVTQPWSVAVPAVGIALLTLSAALIGDGIARAARRGGDR